MQLGKHELLNNPLECCWLCLRYALAYGPYRCVLFQYALDQLQHRQSKGLEFPRLCFGRWENILSLAPGPEST